MKAKRWLLLVALAGFLVLLSPLGASAQSSSGKESNQIKLLPNTVEIIAVTTGAEKCARQKGTTVRLRVTSETPVDVRRFASMGKQWVSADFPNQKKGDVITDYFCTTQAEFKFYSRPVGSTTAWPKP